MSKHVTFIDNGPPFERNVYLASLRRAGLAVVGETSETVVHIRRDESQVLVRCSGAESAFLSRDIAPDDLARFVRLAAEAHELRAKLEELQGSAPPAALAISVVHDANNALMAMLFAARELIELGGEAVALARQIEHGCEHLSLMFRHLLALKRRSPTQPSNINVVISNLTPLLRSLVGSASDVVTQLEDPLPAVWIDPTALERIVLNLVANASEAVHDGSSIVVKSSRFCPGPDDASGIPAGRWVLVEVQDQGAGMDENTLAHAVVPFFTTKAEGTGTGLGLSSTLRMIDDAGGHLRIESTRGVGTRVRVVLPT